jgi:3-oxoacyl-[acyl-carrier protein] reductase
MNLELTGKVAVVAGASRGIGLYIARALATEGCKVLICARSASAVKEAAESLRADGLEVESMTLDIASDGAGERLANAAIDAFGGIDIYVGNAGGNRRKEFSETTDLDWHEMMTLNFHSHASCSRAVIPHMRAAGGGSITFISSIFGREAGGAGLSIYNTTKSALISLAKIMAIELGKDSIRVNTVAPGSIRWPGGSWDKRCISDPEAMAAFIETNLPMGRFGSAEEVADVVCFLSSARASWISGACLNVDGVQSKSLI